MHRIAVGVPQFAPESVEFWKKTPVTILGSAPGQEEVNVSFVTLE